MIEILNSDFHMWIMVFLTFLVIVMFAWEKFSIEMTALGIMGLLLMIGQVFPLYDSGGTNLLNPGKLLAGFANPSLFAVLSLLVIGQAILQAQALNPIIKMFLKSPTQFAVIGYITILVGVMVFSGIMNNTPLVILAIPIMQALAMGMNVSESRVMIPLSYAAILGGMVTLIGSSTNLLVSSALVEVGQEPFSFFEFSKPGAIIAAVGLFYVVFILPKLVPNRSSTKNKFFGKTKQFIAELDIEPNSKLIGEESENGQFKSLPDVSVRLVQRAGSIILPPFENYTIQTNDIIIVAATRDNLIEIMGKYPGFILVADRDEKADMVKLNNIDEVSDDHHADTRVLSEIMIAPGSRLIDQELNDIEVYRRFGFLVLGIQRRARMVRRRIGKIRLENSDVLLIMGPPHTIDSLQSNQDFVVMAGTTRDMPTRKKAPIALSIFAATVGSAAMGWISIPAAAFAGAVAMIFTRCLNIRQAIRAIDRKIYLLIGTVLGLGYALQVTGGAAQIAESILSFDLTNDPFMAAAILFIFVAILTNILTNNACAILFTPIAVSLAQATGVEPKVFALAVLFAANCSFATPIGYQTNLLVMGPGHYRFIDFFKAGIPLVLIVWVTYCILLKIYFGL